VSDNFDERIEQKIFHAEIVVDTAKVSAEMKSYRPIPVIAEFLNGDGSDNLRETIEASYRMVKQDILSLLPARWSELRMTQI
ncbi:conjugal transfer protein TraG, partial [Tannerella sp. oral taxon BU063 isolate Cell 1/3]